MEAIIRTLSITVAGSAAWDRMDPVIRAIFVIGFGLAAWLMALVIYRLLVTMRRGTEIKLKPSHHKVTTRKRIGKGIEFRWTTKEYELYFQSDAFDNANEPVWYQTFNIFQRKNMKYVGDQLFELKYHRFWGKVFITDARWTWKHVVGAIVYLLADIVFVLVMLGKFP